MTKRLYAALISLVAVAFASPPEAAAGHGGHHHEGQQHASKMTRNRRAHGARQRARARRRGQGRQAVAYVCPMHPDIRERSRGTCPKCLMELVAEPRGAKPGGAKTDAAAAPGRL